MRGNVSAEIDPLSAITSYVFDQNGNRIRRIDPLNLTTSYTIDLLNRTAMIAYPDSTIVTNAWNQAGEQANMRDVTGITTYSRDLNGRLKYLLYPSNKILTPTYDAVNNRTGLLDSDGGMTTYSYDLQNRVTGIVNPFGERTTISYDALDREISKVLGNGMSVSHVYDPAGRETFLGNFSATGAALAAFTSTYDPVGNRVTTLELDGSQLTFSYDPTYQLVNEQRSGSNAYNITHVYDSMGNQTVQNASGQVTSLSYNLANELIVIQLPDGLQTTMTYDLRREAA